MLHGNEIKELDALVRLIDEPNEEMYIEIRHKVLSYGSQAIPVLEEAWVNTLGENDSDRIEDLIENIRRKDFYDLYNRWCADGGNNIWEGYSIIMQYIFPEMDMDACNSIYEKLNKEIWLEINENLTALEKIKVINHVLYSVNNFSTIVSPQVKSESFHLNKLLDNHVANPFSLGVLYIALAQYLKIPVYGVDLPGHFVLAYLDTVNPLLSVGPLNEREVMFYINPSNNGAVFTHNEIRHYIQQLNIKLEKEYLQPTTNVAILNRVIQEMIIVYNHENNSRKEEGLSGIIIT